MFKLLYGIIPLHIDSITLSQNLLHNYSNYILSFKTALENLPIDNYNLKLVKCDYFFKKSIKSKNYF